MMLRFVCATSLFALLAACGGSNGPALIDGGVSPDVAAPPVSTPPATPEDNLEDHGTTPGDETDEDGPELEETLSETGSGATTLIGVAFGPSAAAGARTVFVIEAEASNPDGDQSLGELSIATTEGLPVLLTGDVRGIFDDASSFLIDGTNTTGVIGIPTETDNMPTVGTASFSGGAAGVVIVGDAGFELRNGLSEITVDFAAGSLDATLSDFESVSDITGDLASAPFTSIVLTDAGITGTAFSGGTLETAGGDSLSDVVGTNARIISQGQFFGAKESVAGPAAVGGVVFAEGDDGLIYGSFIAD